MPSKLDLWAREFRRAAKADEMAIFRDHLRLLDLPDQPELLLAGTICVVEACATYAKIDGILFSPLVARQTYDPARSEGAKYVFTFDLCDRAYARILVASKVGELDLADLFEHPWQDYRLCGYRRFWVTRADGAELTDGETAQLTSEIREDLFFDNSEDEIDVDFEDDPAFALVVRVRERNEEDEEEVE